MRNKKRVKEKSNQSEDQYKFLIENSLVGICIIQKQRIKFANRFLLETLGYSLDELGNMNFWDIVAPEDREMVKENKMKREKGEKAPDRYQVEVLKKNGEIFNAELQDKRLTYNDHPAVMCVVIDISERKKAEEEIRRRNMELSILNQIGRTLSSTLNIDDLFKKIYEETSRLMDTTNFFIALYDQEKNEIRFEINVMDGKDKGKQKREWSDGLTEYIISSAKSLLIKNSYSQNLQRFKIRQIGRDAKSWLGVPIKYGGKVLGVIGIQSFEKENIYDQGHLSLLSIIADQAGIAVNNALLFQKVSVAEKEWETTFDSMQELIYVLDSDFRLIKVNSSFAQELKTTKRNLLGKNCFQVFSKEEVSFFCPDPELMKRKKPVHIEFKNPVNNKTYGITYLPTLDEEENILNVIFVGRDITLQKEMEKLMLKMEKLCALRELTSILAHEVKTPLHSISSAAEQLQLKEGEKLENQDVELLDLISKQSDKLYNILGDFLAYTKPEDLSLNQVNINQISQEASESLRNEMRSKNIILDESLDQDLGEIKADSERIKQVIWNILLNAIQALPQGGKITLSTKEEKSKIKMTISDTGEGIPQKDLKLIFSPFYSSREEGTGLGLSIAERIVRAHGGNIVVESLPGKGSSFILTLPKK